MKILLELFWSFLQIGLFSFGGGYAALPMIQDQVVRLHQWMQPGEFTDLITISQMTPGPIGINAATFAGMKVAGLPGSIAATLGFAAPSFVLCIVIARLFYRYGNIGTIQGLLNGLRPAVVALICAAGLSFVALSLFDMERFPKDLAIMQEAFDGKSALILALALVAAHKKVNVIHILLASGVLGAALGMIG